MVKKRPISPALAKSLLVRYTAKGLKYMDLLELREAAFFAVLYFCCARYEEAAKLRMENVTKTEKGNLVFFFMEAKNNQFKECRKSFVSPNKDGSDLGPVKIITYYMMTLSTLEGKGLLFTSLYPSRLPIPGSSLSYSNARKLMLKALSNVGLEEEELKFYGLHSPRIGTTTNASQFISDLELQRSGRWISQETPRIYVIPQEKSMAKMSVVLNEQIAHVR